jgi:hypothetical protein
MQRLVLAATLVTLIGILASACGGAIPHQTTAAARFDKSLCLFTPGPGIAQGKNLACGMLTVPEDRQHPATSRSIRLAVAIFAAPTAPAAGDPVLYLGVDPAPTSSKLSPMASYPAGSPTSLATAS